MGLIELRGTSRRVRPIYLLTPKEYYVVLSHLAPHVRLMAVLAMNTGMRISEILGLQWGDVDFERRTLTIESTKARPRRSLQPMCYRYTKCWSRNSRLGRHERRR
jgi:integrase